MKINLNKIKTLPSYVQVLIAALPSIVLIALFISLIFIPKNNEIKALKSKVAQLDKDISANEAKVKRLDDLIVENEQLKKQLTLLKEQLPEEKEVSVLLKQISELGLRSGLKILLWKPQPRKTDPSNLYVEIPVKVEVLADYHKFGDFLSHISRLPRLVNIADIDLNISRTGSEASAGIIGANFTAQTFASITEQDLPAAPAAVSKGKGE